MQTGGATASLPPTDLDAGVVEVGLAARGVRQQDVLGLQVAVDDPLGLQNPHGTGDLLQEHPDCVLAKRALGYECGKKNISPTLQVENYRVKLNY